ncbi:hypothetical protein GX888_00990 [Candidatus Dojkabacteria bacterium]|uniref:Uncharacterized protein n=1 Tax=Candidatus Dojkabacteria bacterium TaxID=2099670 RepID=A0A847VCZ0_9BACT|nr:hypothetical protein [Candidatus Dojkabacteria bacterium]
MENLRNTIETEGEKEYFNTSDFENLNLPERLPPYEGGGATSYMAKYDTEKVEYLTSMGLEVPEEWMEDGEIRPENRVLLITMFRTAGEIFVLETIRRDLEEVHTDLFREYVANANRRLEQTRVDTKGYRQMVSHNRYVEDIFRDLGHSANPEKRVSREELYQVVRYVIGQFSQNKQE